MIEIGAVLVDDPSKTFYGTLKPVSDLYVQAALDSIGRTREETLKFDDPAETMMNFSKFLVENCKTTKTVERAGFISDNNGFDWQFVNYYFHNFLGGNPFGHSSTNLGSLYKGLVRDMFKNFKHLRQTRHDHNPVNDAMGNAEALLAMKKMGLKF